MVILSSILQYISTYRHRYSLATKNRKIARRTGCNLGVAGSVDGDGRYDGLAIRKFGPYITSYDYSLLLELILSASSLNIHAPQPYMEAFRL